MEIDLLEKYFIAPKLGALQNVANVPPIYYRKPYTKCMCKKCMCKKDTFTIGNPIVNFMFWPQFFGDKIFKVTVLSRYLELSEPSTYGTIGTMGVLSISMLKTMIPDL